MDKSEQECFVVDKIVCMCLYKSTQPVMKQLPAGTISHSIDTALA